ncbi:lysozyme [Nesidiocoris tenuis]|uniref:lysozyme n=1 Tax=Nesidiocoris tenuis TaxID=355587 RepID=A0ABN7B6T1_9HEMI|nr:lysozyme [Nesidiocoris tenuis]
MSSTWGSSVVFAVVFLAYFVGAKLYDRCELAKVLAQLKAPADQISTWVCIAEHESSLNTSAVGPPNWDQSRDHGLFQINDRYWCSPPGSACGISCQSLEDDDIVDDWKCAKRIFKAHRLQEGNGFKAWAVYGPHCSGDTSSYVEGCTQSSRSSLYLTKTASSWGYSFRSRLRPQYHITSPQIYSYPIYGYYGVGNLLNIHNNGYLAYGPFQNRFTAKR